MPVAAVINYINNFDNTHPLAWYRAYWWISIPISALYVFLVFSGKRWVEHRPKFNLRWALVLWSLGLAIFSTLGALNYIPYYFKVIQSDGLYGTICNLDHYDDVAGFWTFVFICSKLPELGDTFFIVLRKQKLIFLHWYHHIVTFIYTWYSYGDRCGPCRYFILMNYSVHTLMYWYYALKATGMVRIPRQVNILITFLQLLQMVGGCYANVYAYLKLVNGVSCSADYMNIYVSMIMYFSYVVLFANFFWQSYMVKPKKTSTNGYMNGKEKLR